MSDITWTNERRRLRDLVPWDHNPREINKREAERLGESLETFGQIQTIAIGPDNEVYDGHQRRYVWAALPKFGHDYEVDVRVSSRKLTEKERQKLVIFLHRGTAGQWDWDKLADNFEMPELLEWGFDESDLQLDWGEDDKPEDSGPQIDKADELRQEWGVELGQLWQLGEHRLICGDCTDADVVARVMGAESAALVVIDPPYGVEYAEKNKFLNAISPGNRIQTPIDGDHGNKKDIQDSWKAAFFEMEKIMSPGAVVYCFMPQGGDQMMMMMMMMDGAGIEPRHELIWLKNNHVLGRVDYAYKHEPILYAWKDGGHKFYGDFQTSILEYPKPQKSDKHPTMKPVELIERLVSNSSIVGHVVYDGFSGSGTTLIACERLRRKCRAVEISPAYCAVTIQRWVDMTGGEPVLL